MVILNYRVNSGSCPLPGIKHSYCTSHFKLKDFAVPFVKQMEISDQGNQENCILFKKGMIP